MNQRERDRERIAERRRLARAAQGRESDPIGDTTGARPQGSWEPDTARGQRFIKVGPGTPVLLLDEAARRLRLPTGKLEAMAAAGELESVLVGGWTRMVPLSEVERVEQESVDE